MVQVVQCECFGTEVTIAIFTNQKYFSVHVQRADWDYEGCLFRQILFTETLAINTKKFAGLYAFVVDEAFRIGYTLIGNKFTKVENRCEAG